MYYNIFTVVITLSVLLLIFRLAKKEADKKGAEMSTTYFTVALPKVYFWIFIIFTALFGIVLALLLVFMILDNNFSYMPLMLFFLVFFCLLIYGSRAVTRWQVQVTDDNMWLTTYTGKVKQYNVQELTVKQRMQALQIFANGKRIFAIDFSHIGYDFFVNWLRMYQRMP